MSENIVNQWLSSYAASAVDGELENHMSHISKEVQVYGVPGFDVVSYDDWRNQCAQEFPQKLIRSLDYDDIRIRPIDDQNIAFLTQEKIVTSEGKEIRQAVEMVLVLNEEEIWLLKQLRILNDEEKAQAGV